MTPVEQMELLLKEVGEIPQLAGVKQCHAGVLIRVGSGMMVLGDNEICQPMALVVAAAQIARTNNDLPLASILDAALEALGTQEAAQMKTPKAACLLEENGIISIAGGADVDLPGVFTAVARALREQVPAGAVN